MCFPSILVQKQMNMSEHTGLIRSYQLLITAACTNTSRKMKGCRQDERLPGQSSWWCPFVHCSKSQVTCSMGFPVVCNASSHWWQMIENDNIPLPKQCLACNGLVLQIYIKSPHIDLTHWGMNKMDNIFQITFWNARFLNENIMLMMPFSLTFLWVQLTISPYWFK